MSVHWSVVLSYDEKLLARRSIVATRLICQPTVANI